MAAVKPQRHGPSLDMTAMCDVSFLLLTFFIMTTQFKSEEAVTINTPSSVSQDLIPEQNLGMVSIDLEGHYYFGVRNPTERDDFAAKLSEKYNLGLTNNEIGQFSKLAEVGVPMKALKQFLALPEAQRARLKLEGIPLDSTDTELVDWIKAYAEVNPNADLAIRGDNEAQYPAVKRLFDELGKADINKFKLITKAEN